MSPLADRFLAALLVVIKQTSLQFFVLLGVLFISGVALTLLSKWIGNTFRQFLFPRFGLYLFGVIGIPVHEFCHALFAKIFFHNIESIKWFDPKGRGGSYGTVVHYYNDRNLYHRIGLFFIGLGPVLLAPLLLFLGYRLLVPGAGGMAVLSVGYEWNGALTFTKTLLATGNWHSVGFYFFLYFALCLTSQMELSPDDFKIARDGILPILLLLFALNAIAVTLNLNLHGRLVQGFRTFLTVWSVYFLVAFVISVLNLAVCVLILNIFNRACGKPAINPFQNS
jgi:hypothetical protein